MTSATQGIGHKPHARVFVPERAEKASATPIEPQIKEAESFGAAVEIDLSAEAEEAVRRGRSADSPAHQARAFLAETEGAGDVPFGQIVSRIARGIDPAEAFAQPAEEGDATAGPGAVEEGEDSEEDETEAAAAASGEQSGTIAVETGDAAALGLLEAALDGEEDETGL